MLARAGTQIHHVVRRFDGLPVVFHDDDRVAHVAEAAQRIQKTAVVALVQADTRLIEHIEDTHQTGADLARQPDSLALASRERSRRSVQRYVVEPHFFEKFEPLDDFLQNPFRHEVVPIHAVLFFKKGAQALDAHGGDLGDAFSAIGYGEALGLQAATRAGLTRHDAHVFFQIRPHPIARRLLQPRDESGHDARENALAPERAPPRLVADFQLPASATVEQDVLVSFGEFRKRPVRRNLFGLHDRAHS